MLSAKRAIENLLEKNNISSGTIFSCRKLEPAHFFALIQSGLVSLEDYYDERGEGDRDKIKGFMMDLHAKLKPVGKRIEYTFFLDTEEADDLEVVLTRGESSEAELWNESRLRGVVDILGKYLLSEDLLSTEGINESISGDYRAEVYSLFNKIEREIPLVGCQTFKMRLTLNVDKQTIFSYEFGELSDD